MKLELADKTPLPKDFVVFYCWQDHLDRKLYRFLIRDALDNAIAVVQSEMPEDAECVLRMDSDTSGKAGSVAIADTILDKIRESTMVVADVNPVLVDKEKDRFYPNPNVMVEVGVAAQALGWRRVVCLFNSSVWSAEKLPFDIRHRRVTGYKCESKAERRKAVSELGSILSSAIRSTMQEICRGEIDPSLGAAAVRRAKDLRLMRDVLTAIHIPSLDCFIERGLVAALHYDAVFFWEGLEAVLESSEYRFYDKELQKRVDELYRAWGEAFHYGGLLFHPVRGGYAMKDFSGKVDEEAYEKMSKGYLDMKDALKELLNHVHENFPEIDIRVTDKIAWERNKRFIVDDPEEDELGDEE